MAKSIRVTMTRPDTDTTWWFDQYPADTFTNFQTLLNAGVELWITGDEDSDLTVVADHYFPTDELYDSYAETANTMIPVWKNSEGADEFESENGLSSTVEVIDEPDLTGYKEVTTEYRVPGPRV